MIIFLYYNIELFLLSHVQLNMHIIIVHVKFLIHAAAGVTMIPFGREVGLFIGVLLPIIMTNTPV